MSKEIAFKVNKITLLFSYITQFFQYSASLLIIPFILSKLDSDAMGMWYLFISVSGVVALLDFGFSTALIRNISFVFAGAKELVKEGTPEMSGDKKVNYSLLNSLLYTSRIVYCVISLLILLLLLTGGTCYIYVITKNSNIQDILYLWITYAFSITVNYYCNYINVFIRGRGLITISNNLIIISKLLYIVLTVGLIYMGWGLWSLVISTFFSSLVARIIGIFFFYDRELKENFKNIVVSSRKNYFPVIWYNAKKFGIASFTTYAFSQANVLLAGAFLDLEEVAQIGLVVQICSALVIGCRVCYNSYYPKICSLWVSNDILSIRRIFIKCQLVGYSLWFLGFSFLIFVGNWALEFIHAKTLLPHWNIIALYALFYFMELTHGNCSMLISSKNTVPFLKASVLSCVVSITLMLSFLNIGLGIYSFPLAMVMVNLPYNSWKWTYEAYKLLN